MADAGSVGAAVAAGHDAGSVGAAVAALRERLAAAGVPTPGVDAELLARAALGWSRGRLLTGWREPLPPAAGATLAATGRRRAAREPLQLIVGSVGFRFIDIEVRPGVFVPRPETEVLAGEAVARTPAGGVVLEPCTGTGAVACAVASETSAAMVIATDTSPAAVALACANARTLGLDVTVLAGDLLDPVPTDLRGRVDVLVCNPPYLAADELAGLEPEVAGWDPPTALVAGPNGNEVADRLVAQAADWLAPGGWLLLEVDPSRAPAVVAAMRGAGLVDATIVADLTGAARFPVARRRGGG